VFKLSGLIAACVLALTVGAANATTFDWSLSGDVSRYGPYISYITGSGMLTASNDGGGQYTVDSFSGSLAISCAGGPPCVPQFDQVKGLLSGDFFGFSVPFGDNLIFYPASPFVDNAGIQFIIGNVPVCGYLSCSSVEIYYSTVAFGSPGYDMYVSNGGAVPILFSLSMAPVDATPLPAALPLFATGLGALGLLGWRRKRKAAAALAA
jgi:hypothetical protein